MDLNEARKLASKKPEPHFMVFRLDYNKQLVLPYKAGMQLVEALESAELLEGSYSRDHKILPLNSLNDSDLLTTKIMPHSEYLSIKMANLLNVYPNDIPRIEKGLLPLEEAVADFV